MFPHEKPAPLGPQNWTPETLRERRGRERDTEILVVKWHINGAREGLWETKKMEGKGKRHAPTETTWEQKGNESLRVYVSHVHVSDQSNLFTH